ncbi:MAG: 50S ribosomal protein L11 methyltransferase [Rhodospirillales bacterium]|nr:50S ribosomal protein L11 methyltransferase [Rhodospirillales bacterium]
MFLACLTLPATLDEDTLERLGTALDGHHVGYYVSRTVEDDDASPWLMRWIVETTPDLLDFTLRLNIWTATQDMPLEISQDLWSVREIPEDTDWLAESYKGFQPFTIASFFIYGSHYDGEIPEGALPLMIDAATAFGSGEHPTTAGCLQVLCDLKAEGISPARILDMGCGSGILAIAAARLWPNATIVGIDIEEEAIEVTRRHGQLNKIPEGQILCAAGDGFHVPLVTEQAPYDLVIANILAGPLREMAKDLTRTLAEKGSVVLSGLLNEQAEDVLSAYKTCGVSKTDHKQIAEWSTLRLCKK